MILHVVEARYERDYVVYLKFNDGAEGYVDLSGELYGEMFAPLKDKGRFAMLQVDAELGTVVWANGADLAPEFLHDHLLVPAQQPSSEEAVRVG
jgi:hypothetical protein